jgi:squalene-hopene/tetraprenyl-beta-curcumene cyclase
MPRARLAKWLAVFCALPLPIALVARAGRHDHNASPAGRSTADQDPVGQPSLGQLAASQDTDSRDAAARGLAYLARASRGWTEKNRCFGCHVQAVTLEALSVGRSRHYTIDPTDLAAMTRALKLGVTAGGHTTGVAFQGAAWARYDELVGANETAELLRYARELQKLQIQDGSVQDDDRRLPVTGGTLETTFQAAETWRQAFARTADDKWLPPLRRAEAFLAAQSASYANRGDVYLQDLNFSLLGLLAAGVSRTEDRVARLVRALEARQHTDGGFGLDPGRSDAFATGQTVYALKRAGFSDGDRVVSRGLRYLVAQQDRESGAWHTYHSSQSGSEKAETMWAVLGLVTVDATSLDVYGIVDGQHVEPRMKIEASARSNQGVSVRKLEVLVDDVRVAGAAGSHLSQVYDTGKLSSGKHMVDVVAEDSRGLTTRRRFEVYAGDVFLTGVGAEFDETRRQTVVSARNIAPAAEQDGTVELQVFTTTANGQAKDRVLASTRRGEPGGLAFTWEGRDQAGKLQPRGRYVARLVFKDKAGKVRQTESTLFLYDSEAAQKAHYGEIEGAIGVRGQQSANTLVELVDDNGLVVQSTRSTEQGNYRFKNVDRGRYRVRVKKEGFKDLEAPVTSTPAAAAPAKADLGWK